MPEPREILERRIEELERRNAELERFAYVASHELQAPLRSVAGFVEQLRKRYGDQLDARGEEFIAQVVDGTRRMQRLIDGLLAYARAGRSDAAREAVDCTTTVARVLATLQADIAARGARVDVGPLPTVEAAPTQVERLFQNLVANALTFSRAATPVVDISAERDDGIWRFSVADNGIGIDPAYRERVFETFQRLHGSDEFPGTGIGLSICRRIVEAHGGEIHAEPGPDGGTVMSFTLEPRSPPAG